MAGGEAGGEQVVLHTLLSQVVHQQGGQVRRMRGGEERADVVWQVIARGEEGGGEGG